MDGHIVHALLALFGDHFKHDVRVQVFNALDAGDSFVERHGADRNWRVPQNGFADLVDVAAG